MIKKRLATALVAALTLALLVSLAVPASAGHRIQNTGRATISLESRGRAPQVADGVARFRLQKRANGAHRLNMTLDVSGLHKRADNVFEAWLVDDEEDTDMNLTTFNTDSDGDATVKVSRNITNIAPYDRIVVTEQRRNRFSTDRTGNIVLSGSLH